MLNSSQQTTGGYRRLQASGQGGPCSYRYTQLLQFVAWIAAIMAVFQQESFAVTYYVATDGSNSAAGSVSQPWRTVSYAATQVAPGDTVIVAPGSYDETVRTTVGGNSESSRIVFRGSAPSDSPQRSTIRGFQIDHPYISLENFDITFRITRPADVAVNPGYGNVIVTPGGHSCSITNNTFRDGIKLISHDFSIDSSTNSITTPTGNFLESGFAPGMSIYLGSSSKTYYKNHGTTKTITAIGNGGHTIFVREQLIAEDRNPWFGIIYAGQGNLGLTGINVILGNASLAAANCVIRGNSFVALFGPNIITHGSGHIIERNRFEQMQSYDAARMFGSNQIFRYNTVRNSPDVIYYSSDELGKIPHPEGGNFYDHMIAFLYTHGAIEERRNISIENNFFENCYNQMGYFEESPLASGLTIKNNVFVGFPLHMSISCAHTTFENNTFYRAPYESEHSAAFGRRTATSPTLVGLSVQRNAFIDGGTKRYNGMDQTGWYGIDPTSNYIADFNMVAGPEALGFSAKRGFAGKEASGINGGDPLFLNAQDPDGADNIPLTSDDGLRPLPNSPLCESASLGLARKGAYDCLRCEQGAPFAHFRFAGPFNWFDNKDPSWLRQEPQDRQGPWKLYSDPSAIGYAPLSAQFDAIDSVSCVSDASASADGITSFKWDFGDGSEPAFGVRPSHIFRSAGTYNVKLTVQNSLGKESSFESRYEVLSSRPNVVLHVPFESSLNDASLRTHSLQWGASSSPAFSNSGRWGASASLDGASSVQVSHRDDLDGLSQFTLSLWFKKSRSSSLGKLLSKFAVYDLSLVDAGTLRATVYDSSAATSVSSVIPGLAADQGLWHHFAVTGNGREVSMYFDGRLVTGATKNFVGPLARMRDRTVDFGVGFAGDLDEVVILDRALAPEEVLTLTQSNPATLYAFSVVPQKPMNLRVMP